MKTKPTILSSRAKDPIPTSRIRLTVLPAILAILVLPFHLHGQTEPSALLDLQSTEKGFLLPRMTVAQRDAIDGPATGLMIFNTTANCLQINYGSPSEPSWYPFGCMGTISTLDCGGAGASGNLVSGQAADGIVVKVPYTGGTGSPHNGQTVASTGVTGLTATLAAGNFASGADSLAYAITGIPTGGGTAGFALNIGGQGCLLSLPVTEAAPTCWAKVNATDTLFFMCHNLAAANTSADPFEPSWEINGGYWQWGRKGPDATQWLTANTVHFAHGPTGPDSTQANRDTIAGWSTANAPTGAWSDSTKTSEDPCPAGFRVPGKAEWDGVLANNTTSVTGTWVDSATNYTTGRFFGAGLMLPAAGYRNKNFEGLLQSRGLDGYYWSSTANYTYSNASWNLMFGSGLAYLYYPGRTHGYSVRCAAE